MPGVPASFTYASADIVEWYDEEPGCALLVWLPSNWLSVHRISCLVGSYPGGWISSDKWLSLGSDRSQVIPGFNTEIATLFLNSGWAYVHVLWPSGWMVKNLQYQPARRFPAIERAMLRAIQWLKTRSAAPRDRDNITGNAAHSLATDAAQYVVFGSSSSADNWGYGVFQPDGAVPYDPYDAPSHRFDPWQVRFSHRVRAAILVDLFSDFRWLDPSLQSLNMIPRFGAPDKYQETPKIGEVPLEVLRDCSALPQIERDEPANRDLALCTFSNGTLGDGEILQTPGTTADQWRALAAPRTPIIGCADVHEVGTAISLEDALKVNELRRGVAWENSLHRIFWGNATNNPNGRYAVGSSFDGLGNFNAYAHHWVLNLLQVPANL